MVAPNSISGAQPQPNDITSTANSHSDPLIWTPAHEARLSLVQAQLSAAQASWSEEQDLWLDEAEALENLQRKHKKAVKKEAKRSARWTAEWWAKKAKVSSARTAKGDSTGGDSAGEDEGDEEKKMETSSQVASRSSLSNLMRGVNSLQRRRSTVSEGDTNPASGRRSTLAEGEISSALRRRSGIERLNTVHFGGILRRLSIKAPNTSSQQGSKSPE